MDIFVVEYLDIDAPAEAVWALLTDVTQMPRWRPDVEACDWMGSLRAPRPGARFRQSNLAGGRSWASSHTVTEGPSERVFSYRMTALTGPVAEWSYLVVPTSPTTCRVQASIRDLRSPMTRRKERLLASVPSHQRYDRALVRESLQGIRAALR